MKKIIKKFFNSLGYKITKSNNYVDFDEILSKHLNPRPIVFDVGANNGQSIIRFNKLFDKPIIHSFEPVKKEYDKILKNFGNKENLFIKKEKKNFNITANTANSSFNQITQGTKWLKTRSKEFNTSEKSFVTETQPVQVDTLDNYLNQNNINKIDLLKIDTQGYEDKVLEGAVNTIKNNKIGIIITEIIFDDVYSKSFAFSDIEKYILPHNFRMVGIDLANNNLFSGLVFFADVMYFNKKIHNI